MNARSVAAGLSAWAGSLLGAALYLASNTWQGTSDLPRMALWTLPYSALIAATAVAIPHRSARRYSLLSYAIAPVVGPALGLGCFAFAVSWRGGWVVAFPVFTCWGFGGVLGLTAAAAVANPRSWPAAVALMFTALIAMIWIHSLMRQAG